MTGISPIGTGPGRGASGTPARALASVTADGDRSSGRSFAPVPCLADWRAAADDRAVMTLFPASRPDGAAEIGRRSLAGSDDWFPAGRPGNMLREPGDSTGRACGTGSERRREDGIAIPPDVAGPETADSAPAERSRASPPVDGAGWVGVGIVGALVDVSGAVDGLASGRVSADGPDRARSWLASVHRVGLSTGRFAGAEAGSGWLAVPDPSEWSPNARLIAATLSDGDGSARG